VTSLVVAGAMLAVAAIPLVEQTTEP